jgi:ubiquinone/menaquinone biosynthesis C-methylase UbiE
MESVQAHGDSAGLGPHLAEPAESPVPAVPNVIGDLIVTSRPLAEYQAMFGLGDDDLRRSILDCAGGAASFTAEVRGLGGHATACDPSYSVTAAEFANLTTRETRRGNDYVREHSDEYIWSYFADPEDHFTQRSESGRRFVADYTAHPEHYVHGRLPELPFSDNSFELVLCSHLLFSYADRLPFEFHLAAITELSRVAQREVRIFPLVAIGNHRYERIGELRTELAATGIATEIRSVDYEFQRGANQMLVCLSPSS